MLLHSCMKTNHVLFVCLLYYTSLYLVVGSNGGVNFMTKWICWFWTIVEKGRWNDILSSQFPNKKHFKVILRRWKLFSKNFMLYKSVGSLCTTILRWSKCLAMTQNVAECWWFIGKETFLGISVDPTCYYCCCYLWMCRLVCNKSDVPTRTHFISSLKLQMAIRYSRSDFLDLWWYWVMENLCWLVRVPHSNSVYVTLFYRFFIDFWRVYYVYGW